MSNLIFRSSRSFWCIISFCISCGSAWRYGKYLNLSFICICHFQPEFLFLSFFAKTQCILFFLTDAKKWQDLRETPKNCSRCPRTSLTLQWSVPVCPGLKRWVFQDFYMFSFMFISNFHLNIVAKPEHLQKTMIYQYDWLDLIINWQPKKSRFPLLVRPENR